MIEPVTRTEIFLNAIANSDTPTLTPMTREEHFLNDIATSQTPSIEPETRQEMFLNAIARSQTPSNEPITREEIWLDAIARKQECGLTPITREEVFLNQILETVITPSEPVEEWETVYSNTSSVNEDTPYNYFWLSSMSDIYPTEGSVWRITVDSTEYRCTAYSMNISNVGNVVCVGNPKYSGGTDDESGAPFNFYNAGWGAWAGDTELSGAVPLKIEQLVTE